MPQDETDRLGLLLHDQPPLRRSFEKRAERHGLSSAQWRLVVRVFKEEGVTQARLAELLEIEPISVSRLIDRMEEAGWIERRADPGDRRVRMIHLTTRSRQIFDDMRSMAAEVYDTALAGLDDDTRRTTIRGLKAIIENLSDDDQTAAAPSAKRAFPK